MSIMEKIAEDWTAVRTLRATVETYETIEGPSGMILRGNGTYETMKSDNRDLYRAALTLQNPSLEEDVSTIRLLKVFDGDTIYQQTTNVPSGKTTVVKAEEEEGDLSSFLAPGGTGKHPLGELASFGILTRLEDAILDGRAVYVIERSLMVSIDEDEPRVVQRLTCSFDQETGALLRVDHYRGQETLIAYTALHDIEINPEIDPAQFTYTPPVGATVHEFADSVHEPPSDPADRSVNLIPLDPADPTRRDPHMRGGRRR